MKPLSKSKTHVQPMLGWSLEMVLDSSQELYRLAQALDWSALEQEFGALYCADNGRRSHPPDGWPSSPQTVSISPVGRE